MSCYYYGPDRCTGCGYCAAARHGEDYYPSVEEMGWVPDPDTSTQEVEQ